jgi:hypothetical protein
VGVRISLARTRVGSELTEVEGSSKGEQEPRSFEVWIAAGGVPPEWFVDAYSTVIPPDTTSPPSNP